MINAYDKIYLNSAQKSLATMLDVAVNEWKYSLQEFYDKFLKSMESVKFSRGDVGTIAGKSGVELAYDVLGVDEREMTDLPINRSPEYWTGWVVAYYQWYSGTTFQHLEKEIPITVIFEMYGTYHEMDILQTVDEINRRRMGSRALTYLQLYRKQMGLTQKELAEAADIPVRTIQQYEQKVKNINKAQAEYIIRLSKVLCCKPEELFEI